MSEEVSMSVSPICVKDGKKYAFVSFTDGTKCAEGKIPECKIISNQGFSPDEVVQLEIYMKRELSELKKMAAGIHVLDSFLKERVNDREIKRTRKKKE